MKYTAILRDERWLWATTNAMRFAPRACAVVLAFVPLVILCGADAKSNKVIDTDRITLRDKTGRIRFSIELSPNGEPMLSLYGTRDDPEIEVGVKDDTGAYVNLRQRAPTGGIVLSANPFGASTISLSDSNMGVAVDLAVQDRPQNAAEISLMINKEKIPQNRLTLRLTEKGEAYLLVDGIDAARSLELGSKLGAPYFVFYDAKDEPRLLIDRTKEGEVKASFKDRKGNAIFGIPPH
jgi:hypothetical protein